MEDNKLEACLLAYREKVQKYLENEWDGRIPWDRYFNDMTNGCFEFEESVNNCAAKIIMARWRGED